MTEDGARISPTHSHSARPTARSARPQSPARVLAEPARVIELGPAQDIPQALIERERAAGREALRRAARWDGLSARRASQLRPSGVVPSGAGAMRNQEKMIWSWPDLPSRLIEEWR